VTAPTVEPLTIADAKTHLRFVETVEDALIVAQIRAARSEAETYTARALLSQTWKASYDAFPSDAGPIVLPKPPLISVTSVQYVDLDGVAQTWSSALYAVYQFATGHPHAQAGYLAPIYGGSYPSTRVIPEAVRVTFVAGYGTRADQVPAAIAAAIKIRLSDLFGLDRETASSEMKPWGPVERLLWPFRVWE
jgi:uncharacterized phiE125 gp8 family phage protein